jgi:TRAP-type C4-dicarboxylate transport system permease small subunit
MSIPQLTAFADRTVKATAALLLMALLVSVALGVLSRALNQPLSWTDELAQYLLVWTGFAGWMIASRSHGHIRITFLANMLRGGNRIALELATQAAVAFMGAALIWYSVALIRRNLDVESISLPFPSAALYVPLPLLGATLILQAIADVLAALRGDANISEGQVL